MPGGPTFSGAGVNADASKSQWAGIFMTAFSAFGGILFGYDTGVISGIKEIHPWLEIFGQQTADGSFILPSNHDSLVTSILSAGTFFGALLGAPVGDYLGRKWGVILANLVFCVGVAMQSGAKGIPLFAVGRVFAGLGVGLVSCLIPLYQSECAPKWIRGAIVSLYQWAVTIGLLLASVVNYGTRNRVANSSWQIPIAIQFIWAFVLTVGMVFLPESPRWYIRCGRDADAARSLARLTGHEDNSPAIKHELQEIRSNLEAEKALGSSTYLDCFRFTHNKMCFRTLTGIFIQAWQQLTGINFIFYYGTTFFQNSGIENSFLISVATNIVNVFMTLPGIWGVERFGRRNLLLFGAAGMCICEFIVAIVGVTVSVDNLAGQRVLIAFVCIYIALFASTWGPICWVVCGEIFPLEIRAKAMSLSVASNWLWNFGIGYATPYLVNDQPGSAGLGVKVFFIWGSTCFCCLVFTWFCVPETKGLSLEQIDDMFQEIYPWQSQSWRSRNIDAITDEKGSSHEERLEEKA